MKKIILFLLILTGLINISYASFPILEPSNILNIDSAILYESSYRFLYTFLGFLVGFFSFVGLFLPLLLLKIPNQYFRRGIYIGLAVLSPFLLIVLIFWITGSGFVIM